MTLPSQSITVLDPGIPLASPSPDSPLVTGVASGGSAVAGTLYSFSNPSTVRAVAGYNQAAEDIARLLSERGGPVYFIPSAGSVEDTISAVTPIGSGPTVTVTGDAKERYTGRIRVRGTGILGTATFDYTLDNHTIGGRTNDGTYSQIRTIPAGGTYTTPTGLIFGFAAGTYTAGTHEYTFSTIPAAPNSTDLGGVATALTALPSLLFPLLGLCATFEDDTAASAMASALSGHLTTLATGFRYARGICDIGSGDTSANVLAEAANWTSRRVVPCYGFELVNSLLPYEGFSVRKVSCMSSVLARAARELISTDLARFASGALEGVSAIAFDSNTSAVLDDAGIATLRTWPGIAGFYVGKARLKSPIGSNFTDLHFGRISDVVCRTVYEAQLPFMVEGFRTQSNGSIDPLDRADVETAVNSALVDKLLRPRNARGTPGHVSAARYTVDPDHNLNTTGQILTASAVRPLGYANEIVHQTGFALEV